MMMSYHQHSEKDIRFNGQVLARFELTDNVRENFTNEIKFIKKPDLRLYSIDIIALGLRDISILSGVYECCLQFELGNKKYRTRKSKYPESRNANYCEIIHFDMELPEDIRFLPNLNIYLIDSLFGGLIEKNI
eukprot:248183_1